MSYYPRHPFRQILDEGLPPSISGWSPWGACFAPCGSSYVASPLGAQQIPPPAPSYSSFQPNANAAWYAAQQSEFDYGGVPPNVDSWGAHPAAQAPFARPSGGPAPSINPAPHQDALVQAAQQSQEDANTIFYGGGAPSKGPQVSGKHRNRVFYGRRW